MKKLFITWQDKRSRKWFPVGQLTFDNGLFTFSYLNGAQDAKRETGFEPLVSFPDLNEVYESEELFPLFKNRVMPRSRPDYDEVIEYLNLPESRTDPLAFLARTGGAKVTDTFEIFPYPVLEDGWYRLSFFAHGLRYMPDSSNEIINSLESGDRLFLAHDFQNPVDSDALLLHTVGYHNVGYCPSYLLDDLRDITGQNDKVDVSVERVNNGSSPLQFRLLCRLSFVMPDGETPFSKLRYQLISSLAYRIDSQNVTFA